MSEDVVFITALPSNVMRRGRLWNDLSCLPHCVRTWAHYCRRHGARLFVWREPERDTSELIPTFQRYFAFEVLERAGIAARNVLLADADTMVRWDAPSMFEADDARLRVVLDRDYPWIYASVEAYAALFPGVVVPWDEYFNAGIVVVPAPQRSLLARAVDFAVSHREALAAVRANNPMSGTDQTPLNYLVRASGTPFEVLSPAFNFQKCVGLPPKIQVDEEAGLDVSAALDELCAQPEVFRFVNMAYVWHFNGVFPSMRERIMGKVLARFEERYSDAEPVPTRVTRVGDFCR